MKQSFINTATIALWAALIATGTFIVIPVPGSPVPIVLQNMLAVMAGMILGPIAGGASVLLFLVAGALGLPVFSGARGGLAILAGPTGGYLFGYLGGAILAGLIVKKPQ
ncbi:MAG TPA: biotin transporter BioY, partial [Spirochaetia bacterium]|nr:biotin transporter BioY [Spirochaetia bacterium]